MAKFRYVYTDFWTDGKVIEEFTPEDKLFFLYLLTNEHTTQIGVYQITKKHMAFELGYSNEVINALMQRFLNTHELIMYNETTREIAIKNWGRYNLTKAGKPILDCVRKELESVKDMELLRFVIDSISNDSIKQLYTNSINGHKNYAEPSKQAKPKDIKSVTKREYLILREGQRCFYTGVKLQLKDIELDHVIPVNSNGTLHPSNLVVSYNKFNNFKSANDDLEEVIELWNVKHPELPVQYEEIAIKLVALKQFEMEREAEGISYAEAVENNLYDTYTLRNYINTIRGQKEKQKEKEEEKEKQEQNGESASPSSPGVVVGSLIDENYKMLQEHCKTQMFFRNLNFKENNELSDLLDEFTDAHLIKAAIDITIENNKAFLGYTRGILSRWKADGITNHQQLSMIGGKSNGSNQSSNGRSNSFQDTFGHDVGF